MPPSVHYPALSLARHLARPLARPATYCPERPLVTAPCLPPPRQQQHPDCARAQRRAAYNMPRTGNHQRGAVAATRPARCHDFPGQTPVTGPTCASHPQGLHGPTRGVPPGGSAPYRHAPPQPPSATSRHRGPPPGTYASSLYGCCTSHPWPVAAAMVVAIPTLHACHPPLRPSQALERKRAAPEGAAPCMRANGGLELVAQRKA